jgi:type III restriction enzyme
MPEDVINPKALQPLYAPWDLPNKHRVKGGEVHKGRRPSGILVAQNLRAAVQEWREGIAGGGRYAGASETTLELLEHWFLNEHRVSTGRNGSSTPFRYHFCQQEAIETLIYLLEVRRINRLTTLVAEFGGHDAETAALGVNPEYDQWAKYAFKMATGSGKTKVMSLAIVWSYFHALRESDSPMAKHFVAIAPNITVFERLKEDFKPPSGGRDIFDADPLIPPAWRGDWNLTVLLQDEVSGATTGGILYLTNIHRLYDTTKRKGKKGAETYDWAGPAVSKAKALDIGSLLRDKVTSHKGVMILNDEAHHVWDPDSAWNEAIEFTHTTIRRKFGEAFGIAAQLDFSATPKDNKGQFFQNIICDFPLGEAVDAGIVKTPIIGRATNLKEQPGDDAAVVYQRHLLLGYERWKASRDEWARSGKKPLMFVMTEDTEAADQIARELNRSELFKELNGRTINLHTNLKGKLKKVGKGTGAHYEFVESDKEISDDDLEELRKLSRELDTDPQHYCIVSVLMLREGWDVRNVTTIVPLRPYTSKANILPEQTLGRGLRRMTAPGDVDEILTVVEHKAFASLYQQELSQQGLEIEIVEVDKVPRTTVTIYPDPTKPNFRDLEIELPQLIQEYHVVAELKGLTIDDVRSRFHKIGLRPIRLGEKAATEIPYEGRTLLTDEIVQQMTIHIPLLKNGFGAVAYYREQMERMCSIRGTHAILAPLIQSFLEEILFEERREINDPQLVNRLGDADVAEHLRAVFVPLIRERIIRREERALGGPPVRLSSWKPFQATHSETRPTVNSPGTLFNLVPCNRELEVAFAKFATASEDVSAFAKNAGPQALRIDYLASGARLAFYTPDFFVRTRDGNCFLVETKGREDKEVPAKARAASSWCKAATSKRIDWTYVYVPQGTFERLDSNRFGDLVSLCQPALAELIQEDDLPQLKLFARIEETANLRLSDFIRAEDFQRLPPRHQTNVTQAVMLFRFTENKPNLSFAPVFTPLIGSLEDGCNALLIERLSPYVPNTKRAQEDFFSPDLSTLPKEKHRYYASEINKLQRVIVHKSPISPMGHLKFALEIGLGTEETGMFFDALHDAFGRPESKKLLDKLVEVYEFRNKYIAHYEKEIVAKDAAESQLGNWIALLVEVQQIRSRDAVLMRYRELVERKHLSGKLGSDDASELTRLQAQLDHYDDSFYRPILARLKTLARREDS